MPSLAQAASHTSSSAGPSSSEEWIAAVDIALDQMIPAALDAARASALARCVDGQIIGTGQADFTQGNTAYTLHHQGRTFQLMDVPGIEGHERKFAHLVTDAIAKAHLVFYVNGTNKKPEATTVKKVQAYLGRGTQVCVLANVKEYADAYEFEEDRIGLNQQVGPMAALRQTEDVLSAALKAERLLPGQCVQGLLAFSALALGPQRGQSTVHPTRSQDLGVHQRKYLRAFGTAEAMRTFSRIDAVAGVLTAKAQTFREDIIEANKSKVRELIADTLQVLGATLDDHAAFMLRVEPELATGSAAIDQALQSFSRLALAERQSQVQICFNALDTEAAAIVSEHFGDKAAISAALEQAFHTSQGLMVRALESGLLTLLGTLEADLHRAVERLLQNLQRADFERRMAQTARMAPQALRLDPGDLNMDRGLGEWGRIAVGVGSLAYTGAQLGLAFPPWGAFIGAGVGLIVGAVLGLIGLFNSQPEKVRKAQARVQKRLDDKRTEALASATEIHDKVMTEIRAHVDMQVRPQLEQLHAALAQPGQMVEQQINVLGRILRQVEDMPNGTVQAVRL